MKRGCSLPSGKPKGLGEYPRFQVRLKPDVFEKLRIVQALTKGGKYHLSSSDLFDSMIESFMDGHSEIRDIIAKLKNER